MKTFSVSPSKFGCGPGFRVFDRGHGATRKKSQRGTEGSRQLSSCGRPAVDSIVAGNGNLVNLLQMFFRFISVEVAI